jgi:hypothetical protein
MATITQHNAIVLARKIATLEPNETLDFYAKATGYDEHFATMIEINNGLVILIGQYGGGNIVSFDCTYISDDQIAIEIEPLVSRYLQDNAFEECYIDDDNTGDDDDDKYIDDNE